MNNQISLGEQYDSIEDLDDYVSVLSYEQQFDESKKDELQAYENTRDEALMDWFQENYGDDKYVDTYEFDYSMVDHYRIKGVWYFDKKVSELKYRPIAIAPVARQVINKKDDASVVNPIDYSPAIPMFWIYYPDARDVLKGSDDGEEKKNFLIQTNSVKIFHHLTASIKQKTSNSCPNKCESYNHTTNNSSYIGTTIFVIVYGFSRS
jgi:hypothetical protein